MTSTLGPCARSENLIITDADTGSIIYDQDRHHIHHLNVVSNTVWHLCDGHRTLAELASLTALDEHTVRDALTKLSTANLLTAPLAPELLVPRTTRRRFHKQAVGTLATIISISAPTAAAAASICSGQGGYCLSDDYCCNGMTCVDLNTSEPFCI